MAKSSLLMFFYLLLAVRIITKKRNLIYSFSLICFVGFLFCCCWSSKHQWRWSGYFSRWIQRKIRETIEWLHHRFLELRDQYYRWKLPNCFELSTWSKKLPDWKNFCWRCDALFVLFQLSKYSAEALEIASQFDSTNFTEDTRRQLKEVCSKIRILLYFLVLTVKIAILARKLNREKKSFWTITLRLAAVCAEVRRFCWTNWIWHFRLETNLCRKMKKLNWTIWSPRWAKSTAKPKFALTATKMVSNVTTWNLNWLTLWLNRTTLPSELTFGK